MKNADYRIQVGDKVSIYFENPGAIVGTVLYSPVASGDCWHIRTEDGDTVYVQNFCIMQKMNP